MPISEPSIGAGAFKSTCLQIIDEVARSRRPLIITKHGKPVARLVPLALADMELFGALSGSVTHDSDIVSPLDEEWHADR